MSTREGRVEPWVWPCDHIIPVGSGQEERARLVGKVASDIWRTDGGVASRMCE